MKFRDYIEESEKEFWSNIYKNDETHWLNKKPSRLTQRVLSQYGNLGNVLEIGCAGGIDTFELAKNAKSVIGIDIVPDAIKIAKTNLSKQPKNIQNKVTLEVGDAEKLRFDDNMFDFVYSLSVLHSTDPNKSMKELHRVLKSNGKAVIYVFIGGNEGIDKDIFLSAVKKYFIIKNEKIIDIKKDKGGDEHQALILDILKDQ